MILTRNNLGIFCLTILLGFGALTRPTWAQPISHLKLDPHQIPWAHLSFHAKNFWVEVSTDIQMKSLRASDLDAVLLASPKGIPIKPQTSQINEMTINTIIDPRFRSPVKIHNRIWFNPTDASAIGRVRLRRGEDDFKKVYRFTDRGVFRHRMEPKDKKEALQETEKWTDIKNSFYPYDMNHLKCADVTERSLLIYILSAAATARLNNGLSLCVFGKRQLHHVQLQKQGVSFLDVNYIEENEQKKVRKQARIKTLQFTIIAEPLESELNEAENFSFLGFHKDITIYIEPTTGLPVQASGIISAIGKANLKLRQVSFKHQSD